MANPNTPNGFVFVKRLDGSTKAPEPWAYPVASSNEPMAKGDVISLTSAGAADRTCTDGGGGHDQTTCVGILESVMYKDASGNLHRSTYLPANQGDGTKTLGNGTGAIAFVQIALDCVYSVQCDTGGSIAIAQTLVGNAADPVALEATDPVQLGPGGISAMELDTSTAGSAADLFHILSLDERPGMVFSATEADSRYGRVLVTWAENMFGQIPTASGI